MTALRIFATLLVLAAPAAAQQSTIAFGGLDQSSGLPIEVVSDRLEVDQNTGDALFTGNVVATQGEMVLTGERVRVFYSQGENRRITEVHAFDNVTLVTPTEAAEGQKAVYNVDTGDIVMTEDVLVTQGQSAIAGTRLVVDLETGLGQMEGRVRSVFQTSDE